MPELWDDYSAEVKQAREKERQRKIENIKFYAEVFLSFFCLNGVVPLWILIGMIVLILFDLG